MGTENSFKRDIRMQLSQDIGIRPLDGCGIWNFAFLNSYVRLITGPSPVAHGIPSGRGVRVGKKRAPWSCLLGLTSFHDSSCVLR